MGGPRLLRRVRYPDIHFRGSAQLVVNVFSCRQYERIPRRRLSSPSVLEYRDDAHVFVLIWNVTRHRQHDWGAAMIENIRHPIQAPTSR